MEVNLSWRKMGGQFLNFQIFLLIIRIKANLIHKILLKKIMRNHCDNRMLNYKQIIFLAMLFILYCVVTSGGFGDLNDLCKGLGKHEKTRADITCFYNLKTSADSNSHIEIQLHHQSSRNCYTMKKWKKTWAYSVMFPKCSGF